MTHEEKAFLTDYNQLQDHVTLSLAQRAAKWNGKFQPRVITPYMVRKLFSIQKIK